jgi:hypothetical protein
MSLRHCGERVMRMRSSDCIGIPFWPSRVRKTDSKFPVSLSSMADESRTTTGRSVRVCGQMGVMMKASTAALVCESEYREISDRVKNHSGVHHCTRLETL